MPEGCDPQFAPARPKLARPRRPWPVLLLSAAIVVAAGVSTWWLDARIRASNVIHVARTPSDSFVGHLVPDFALADVRTGQRVRLSDSLGQRPVVLLFGSFSCPRLFGELPAIRRLHEEYGHEVDFRLVYSKEAYHQNPEFEEFCQQHPEVEQRGRVRAGLEFYQLDFPCVLADAELNRACESYPARVIVFDRTGAPVFDSKPALTPAGLQLDEATLQLKECLSDHNRDERSK